MSTFDDVAAALGRYGLVPRGGIAFDTAESRPPGPSGRPATSVLLVGHAGGAPWPHFSAWRQCRPAADEDPLDTWSREVIGEVAALVGARAVSPADRPFLPFQAWAMRAEALRPSPLGILMHPEYGLWHAYRGALLFDEVLPLPGAAPMPHPCDSCAGKPCLATCPVEAFSADGFAPTPCRAHLASAAGAACRGGGCLARNACPVGTGHRYPVEMQSFLMAAFAAG